MSKFKIKMKLQGFELEIEGSREDVPLITQNLAEQFASLIKPSAAILEGEILSNSNQIATIGLQQPAPQAPKKRAERTSSVKAESTTNGQSNQAPIDWRHEPEKYGTPQQNWSIPSKYIWTLYVIKEVLSINEASGITLANTFNKHFKQSGTLVANNAKRDIGRLKTKKPPQVGEDTTQNPSVWFLTESGIKSAQKLIQESLGTA